MKTRPRACPHFGGRFNFFASSEVLFVSAVSFTILKSKKHVACQRLLCAERHNAVACGGMAAELRSRVGVKQQSEKVRRIAREKLGFRNLRPGQQEAIEAVLAGRDTLAVMPTGSGKSAIYQIPGVALHGPTVVVCPLIALQKDQIDSIEEQEVASAAVVNSVVPESERREALEDVGEGDVEFVFLAPEQLRKPDTMDRLREGKPSLFVVDEAHCISEWGHDFRPDYLALGGVIEALGHPRVLALTATASPIVREEIVTRLGMRDPRVIVRGFDRPNIWLGVESYPDEASKRDALLDRVADAAKPGIVYVSSRRHAEEIARELDERGIHAVHYHAGMRKKEREAIHDDFMSGRADVIAATSAFGMGVDKAGVRFVFHYDIPDSIDSYYQEVGRAGRDGAEARAILFYRPEDLNIHKFFKGGGKVNETKLAEVVAVIHAEDGPLDSEELREKTDLSKTKMATALNRLEETGAVERLPGGQVAAGEEDVDLREAVRDAVREEERRREYNHLRLEKMRAYAELASCRRAYLLNYFGEEHEGDCGFCDNCQAGAAKAAPRHAGEPFPVKSRVMHKEWGKGLVEEYDRDRITILFDDVGRKTLAMSAVVENSLLERAG